MKLIRIPGMAVFVHPEDVRVVCPGMTSIYDDAKHYVSVELKGGSDIRVNARDMEDAEGKSVEIGELVNAALEPEKPSWVPDESKIAKLTEAFQPPSDDEVAALLGPGFPIDPTDLCPPGVIASEEYCHVPSEIWMLWDEKSQAYVCGENAIDWTPIVYFTELEARKAATEWLNGYGKGYVPVRVK